MRHRLHEARLFSLAEPPQPAGRPASLRLRGRGVDFDQVASTQPGDDVRTIDWRVTARTREPHTPLFHEERERPVFVLVEQSQRLFFGSGLCFKAVLAARAAASSAGRRWPTMTVSAAWYSATATATKSSRDASTACCNCSTSYCGPIASSETPAERPGELFGLALRRAREVLRPGSLIWYCATSAHSMTSPSSNSA